MADGPGNAERGSVVLVEAQGFESWVTQHCHGVEFDIFDISKLFLDLLKEVPFQSFAYISFRFQFFRFLQKN